MVKLNPKEKFNFFVSDRVCFCQTFMDCISKFFMQKYFFWGGVTFSALHIFAFVIWDTTFFEGARCKHLKYIVVED